MSIFSMKTPFRELEYLKRPISQNTFSLLSMTAFISNHIFKLHCQPFVTKLLSFFSTFSISPQ